MNRVVIFLSEEISKNEFCITSPERLSHLHLVLKVKKGDSLKVAVLNRGLGQAIITHITEQNVVVRISSPLSRPTHPPVKLLVALSRPPTVKKILEHATSMGVSSFCFFKAQKSEKSYGDARIFQKAQWEKALLAGMAQSTHLFKLPKVRVETIPLSALLPTESEGGEKFFLSTKGERPFSKPLSSKITLGLGPERGWSDGEEALLLKEGFVRIKVSKHILRTEIATFAALSQIELLQRA